jgi:hypothetical protein
MPYLSGPLDLGTRGFVERREDAVEEVFLALVAGEGPDRLRRAIALHAKERLAGVDWRLTEDPELLPSVVGGLGGAVVGAVLRPLLETRGAAAGLPDLVILPGPPAKVQDAIPARLSSGAMLVEVKGPTDTVRDAQAVWFGRLLDAGATVEVWEVRPRGKATTPSPG